VTGQRFHRDTGAEERFHEDRSKECESQLDKSSPLIRSSVCLNVEEYIENGPLAAADRNVILWFWCSDSALLCSHCFLFGVVQLVELLFVWPRTWQAPEVPLVTSEKYIEICFVVSQENTETIENKSQSEFR
jgi:hypothetical protein